MRYESDASKQVLLPRLQTLVSEIGARQSQSSERFGEAMTLPNIYDIFSIFQATLTVFFCLACLVSIPAGLLAKVRH